MSTDHSQSAKPSESNPKDAPPHSSDYAPYPKLDVNDDPANGEQRSHGSNLQLQRRRQNSKEGEGVPSSNSSQFKVSFRESKTVKKEKK
jgi:hypothetical protein